ncbi:MAG: glycosyltransferase family 2 protein [Elusimicrobiota bacterium]|jgi:glycosyltransferase involved in cell wall biosynthesis
MTKVPKVSVNLCCYNSARFLEETLASVFAQNYTDYELVIVNDGSRDATDAIIKKHLAAGRPIVYLPQENAGLGASRNKALAASSGEIIAIIDHDDVWEPRKLELLVPFFDRPGVSFVGSDALMMDSQGRPLRRYSEGITLHRGRILRELFLCNFVPCAAAMMRRSAIAAAGGLFRPDFHIAEEYELFLRLAEQGEFDFSPEPLVRIRVHSNSAGWDFAQERSELRKIYAQFLTRHPELNATLGRNLLAAKSAGFWVSPELAAAFAGQGPAALRAQALLLGTLSRLAPGAIDGLRSLKRAIQRRLIASRESGA